MPMRKTAIAVPDDLLADVDRVARARGESRSRFITRILRAAIRARHDAEIVRRLNEVFADEDVQRDQLKTARTLEQFAGLDDESW